MVGYRTVIFNILGPVFVWLGAKGVNIDPDAQAVIVTAIMAAGNLVLRWFTTTAIGEKS